MHQSPHPFQDTHTTSQHWKPSSHFTRTVRPYCYIAAFIASPPLVRLSLHRILQCEGNNWRWLSTPAPGAIMISTSSCYYAVCTANRQNRTRAFIMYISFTSLAYTFQTRMRVVWCSDPVEVNLEGLRLVSFIVVPYNTDHHLTFFSSVEAFAFSTTWALQVSEATQNSSTPSSVAHCW